ncbi:hypothetical protein [Kangiella spongicola]|uniref:Uncharacterized protein n=1 Tax=Kangiella spongicola TaxID=796379 RepID=A0A318D6C4_9GAMM|nr:hypothetical protein [Kangiella spongicola]PXF64383.1 hypothetical protein DL796_04385 [Kangiella spongicola]
MRQNIKTKEYLNRNKPKPYSPLPVDVLLKKNQHTLVVMTPDEFLDFFVRYYKKKGLSDNDIVLLVIAKLVAKGHSDAKRIQEDWEENRDNIKTAGGFLPTIADAKALSILAYDLKRGRNLWSNFRIQNTAGTSYIILEGNHRLRQHLTGTRYLANNPKVVSMGLGQKGANKAIRGGGVVTVVFSVFFHGMDQLMYDELTWHHFVGGLAADVVIAAAAAGITWAAVVGLAALGVVIGPLAAVLFVGTAASLGLSFLFSKKLSKLFSDSLKSIEDYLKIKPLSAGKVILLASNFGKVSLENTLTQLTLDIKQAKNELPQNLRYSHKDPQGFFHRVFGVPDTRNLFK